MAKIPFGKLKLKKVAAETTSIIINDVEVEVIKHLPIKDVVDLASRIVAQTIVGSLFFDPMKFNLYFNLEVVKAYTNITFTEKQQEDVYSLYDLLNQNGVFSTIDKAISEELITLRELCEESCYGYFEYKNSFGGVFAESMLQTDTLVEKSDEVRKNLADPENMAFLKDVIQKMP